MSFLKYLGKQFCLTTHLHGYKFIALPRRAPLERFLWTVIVVFFWSSALFILIYVKYRTTRKSTILVTDSINYPVWNYPFPAITICNFNKISKMRAHTQAEQIQHKLNHSVEEIANLFALLGQLYFYSDNIQVTNKDRYLQLLQLLDHNRVNLNRLLRSLSPSCSSIVKRCRWKGEDKDCDTIFEKIITSEGHCCSFNYYAPRNHKFGGLLYPARSPPNPRRVSACGYSSAFEALVSTNSDDYLSSDNLGFGNKILIHNSYDYPDWGDESFLLGMKVTALLGVNPSRTYSTDNFRSLSIRERACYFEDELPLKNFKHYTYQNCLTECRMNLTQYYCGCIPVVYINEDDLIAPNHKVCSVRDIECLYLHRQYIRSTVPGIEIEAENFTGYVWDSTNQPCRCLPECSSTTYDFHSSLSFLETKHTPWTDKRGLYYGVNISNHSVLRVYFDDLVGTRNRRSVIGNWQTFLAFYGGILGLFVGFSFIAGIELIYFFTVKILIDSRKPKKFEKKPKRIIKQFLQDNGKSRKKEKLEETEVMDMENEENNSA
ncbi:sodium channel protein Nach-like [Coccinella septempunctata]|uniref:sodium channel protein Nach-like n=1 Tax=Coccinella septempunctata TaxID=41139 RepID=UPI001D090AD1|nr:sodium channel protein Nach-like [Coccinella septempunctata]